MPGAGAWGPARTEAVRRKEAPAAAAEGQSVWPEQDGQGQRGRRPAAGARGHRDSEAGGGSLGFMRSPPADAEPGEAGAAQRGRAWGRSLPVVSTERGLSPGVKG